MKPKFCEEMSENMDMDLSLCQLSDDNMVCEGVKEFEQKMTFVMGVNYMFYVGDVF